MVTLAADMNVPKDADVGLPSKIPRAAPFASWYMSHVVEAEVSEVQFESKGSREQRVGHQGYRNFEDSQGGSWYVCTSHFGKKRVEGTEIELRK
jgi:hypothetical protein